MNSKDILRKEKDKRKTMILLIDQNPFAKKKKTLNNVNIARNNI